MYIEIKITLLLQSSMLMMHYGLVTTESESTVNKTKEDLNCK